MEACTEVVRSRAPMRGPVAIIAEYVGGGMEAQKIVQAVSAEYPLPAIDENFIYPTEG